MADTIPLRPDASQASPRDRNPDERSTSCDPIAYGRCLDDFRQAMKDTGWNVEALAKHLGVHRSYVDRMLDADKAITLERTVALPDDLEARFYAIRAESMGAIVVAPLTGLAAQKALVAGLLGLMSAPQLPAKAGAPIKADLPDATRKSGTR